MNRGQPRRLPIFLHERIHKVAVFRVERIKDYTVMSNHHLRNKNLSLKAKGLLSQMLSLPDDWDYTLKGLAAINKESVDAIRTAIWELEDAGYVVRTRVRDERGCLRGCDYYVYEYPQTLSSGSGSSAESVPPMLEPLASDSAALGNPMQLNKEIQNQFTDTVTVNFGEHNVQHNQVISFSRK